MPEAFPSLSKREREVVELASEGLLDKEIMLRLGITENTLKTYWKRIRSKLGDNSRTGLVAEYLNQRGFKIQEADINFEADWIYDLRRDVWTQTSDRPLPGNISIDKPITLDEVLSYFHPEDAEGLRELVLQLKDNDVDNFFFRARILVSTGFVQTSTFVHVLRDSTGKPITLLGHRSKFHDLAPIAVQNLMVGYWELIPNTGDFTADINLLFIFGTAGSNAGTTETIYQRISPGELKEIRQLVGRAVEQRRTHLRTSHRLDAASLPFRWATIDAHIAYDAQGNGTRAHGSVLAFN